MEYEIINYKPEAQKWYIAAEYEYIDGKPPGSEAVSVTDFNTNSCFGFEGARFTPPPGAQQFSNPSPDFTMAQDGTILYAMGHLHDGGENIELGTHSCFSIPSHDCFLSGRCTDRKFTTVLNNQTVCDSRATYGGKNAAKDHDDTLIESIEAMSACTATVPIKKGDKVKLISHYDMQKHPV